MQGVHRMQAKVLCQIWCLHVLLQARTQQQILYVTYSSRPHPDLQAVALQPQLTVCK
jgi:hypothetical protein